MATYESYWKIWLRPNLSTKNVENNYIAEASAMKNTLCNEDVIGKTMENHFCYSSKNRNSIVNTIIKIFPVLLLFFITSCNENGTEDFQPTLKGNITENLNWQCQLQKIIDTPPAILKKSGITLLGYTLTDNIDDDMKVSEIKKILKSEENMIPAYSDDLKSMRAITKSEAREISNDFQQYTFSECGKYIDDHISTGMKVLSLKWNNRGVETTTSCVVSDELGIVYDNFLINAFIANEPVITTTVVKDNNYAGRESRQLSSSLETSAVKENFSGFVNWVTSGTADWLWGSERGHAVITHTGHYYYGSFLRHNFSASHYFTLGHSEAKVSEIAINRIAYGYAFSTPGIKINLSLSGYRYNLSFGTMIGSTAGETGEHSHPLTYCGY